MKKLIVLSTSLVLFLVFVVPFCAALFIKLIPNVDQPGFDFNNKRGIYGLLYVTQSFTSTDNNLAAIGTSLGNPNLMNKKEIIFDLTDLKGNLVRQVKINGMNVPDGSFFKFNFDPIADSKDKKYVFTISSPYAGPEDLVNIFFSSEKSLWIGPATFDKEINENGMPIVAYFKPQSHLKVAKDIYLSWLGRVF